MTEQASGFSATSAGLDTDEGLRQAHRAYQRRMLGLARRIVVDPHLAEEVVQEAFLRAWRASSTFDPEAGPMLPWLLTITRNAAIDAVKARTRRPPLAARPADDAVESDGLRFEDRVLARAELADALRRMDDRSRQVIVETVLRDRSSADVAAELGLPAGTVRSRSHYALRRLRDLLGETRAASFA